MILKTFYQSNVNNRIMTISRYSVHFLAICMFKVTHFSEIFYETVCLNVAIMDRYIKR